MKVDAAKAAEAKHRVSESSLAGRLAPYWELSKPRVTLMVVLTSSAAFYLASALPIDYLLMFEVAIGTALLAAGTSGLNQLLERKADGKMRRTSGRPLPSGRIQPRQARNFGLVLLALGVGYLAWVAHVFTPLLGCLTVTTYLCLYTPLKRKTHLCTVVGAVPGALPLLMGWAAARGEVDAQGLVLFVILFAWQFPHFLSIAWIYREDYLRGGFVMLPVADSQGKRTGGLILGFSALLLLLTILPKTSGLVGNLYLAGALFLGTIFLLLALRVALSPSRQSAKQLLRASVIHLPLLLILMMVDKGGG